MAHGEIDIETPFLFGANPQLTVPSGTVEHTVRASIFGSYGFSLKPYINTVKVWLRADSASTWSTMNSVRHDVQLIGGFSLAY
ncbi:MAG: hypothetical protein WC129_02610 [Sphaerochaetaceae bacterium]|nr:hypothetical protein [Sphaerochaetaceae bacterium]NLV83820.1 hypothetical protein [Spirochaetales bacterium]